MKPTKVAEGDKVHFIVKITSYDSEFRRHHYGSGGYPDYLKDLPD
jgi:hypothetical protein